MLANPESIGPYRILDLLGEGGMGVVYAAEQRVPFQRRVALKVVKVGMDTKEVLARFEAERQALAMLDHPSIARVLDAGATEAGRPYFAMELVRGLPINRYCDVNRLTIPQRVQLIMQAAAGLQHAHDRGILHRDVKPSNLLVTDIDGNPHVKIIDFGLAKATNHRLTERTVFTEEGRIIGTPEYMSPEQAEMSALDVDHRTDVYSLGVVLYELVAGALPFDPRRLRDKGYLEIQRIIREEDPPTPSKRLSQLRAEIDAILALRRCGQGQLVNSLRGGLDAATMVAIAKNRNERYSSCREMALDLRAVIDGEAPRVAKEKRWSMLLRKGRRLFRRHAAFVSVVAGLVCVAIVTAVLMRPDADAEARRDSMLRERDQRISELSGDVARLRGQVDELNSLKELANSKVSEDDPAKSGKLVVARDVWGAAQPEQKYLVRRTGKSLVLTALHFESPNLAVWMKQRQALSMASHRGDVDFHFVLSPEGMVAEARSTDWSGFAVDGRSVDGIVVCLLLGEGTEMHMDQVAALRRLVASLTEDGLVDVTTTIVDESAGEAVNRLTFVKERFLGASPVATVSIDDLVNLKRNAWSADPPRLTAMDPMERISKLTLHHSAILFRDESEAAAAVQIQMIDRDHRGNRGYGDIGYHFLVDPSGRVIEGRSLAYTGAHATGENNLENIGICLLGNFLRGRGGQEPTAAQIASTERLLDQLRQRFSIPADRCFTHSDFKQTVCPGELVETWFRDYLKRTK